jgi:hypothetical protein
MFPTDIALAGTSVTDTFALQSIQGGKSIRADAAATPGIPRTVTISHQEVSRSGGPADRHLVRLDRSFSPAEEGDPIQVASVQLVIEVPRSAVNAAAVQNMVDQLEAFLGTAGYLTKLLNSEP